MLLVHGHADRTVDPARTQRLTAAQRAGGHPVRTEIVPNADIYRPAVVAPFLVTWLRDAVPVAH